MAERDFAPETASSINAVKRLKDRGNYDAATVYEILDEAIIAHVGFTEQDTGEQYPVVIPMIFGRREDEIFLHGHLSSRQLKTLEKGAKCCITVTHVDALILALTSFHNSMNYRSVVLFGSAKLIPDAAVEEKNAALTAITDHAIGRSPSRWADSRLPDAVELKSTKVLSFKIDSASAKACFFVRTGGPKDEKKDIEADLDHWVGIVERKKGWEKAIPADYIKEGVEVPDYVQRMLQ
ncbi:hypothetical protein BT69DRAFT_1322481 [Atractiella rhizophila]|nr:hypothetical protein BT69DRAFT_1322481 [Atractiella rhizophila]